MKKLNTYFQNRQQHYELTAEHLCRNPQALHIHSISFYLPWQLNPLEHKLESYSAIFLHLDEEFCAILWSEIMENIIFKNTMNFFTSNFIKEKPLLTKTYYIVLFEVQLTF